MSPDSPPSLSRRGHRQPERAAPTREVEFVTQNPPGEKSPGPGGFSENFLKQPTEEFTPIVHNPFKEIKVSPRHQPGSTLGPRPKALQENSRQNLS